MTDSTSKAPKKQRTMMIMVLLVFGMFGFGYAMVPLYNVFCKVTGLNGKTANTAAQDVANVDMDKERVITIEFTVTQNADMPWTFYPKVKSVKVHPGENKRIEFYAHNNADHTVVGQAIPSIAPNYVAKYFLKTECFCFTQQTLKAGESRNMPVVFHIDKKIPKEVKRITLSYTLFDTANIGKKAIPNPHHV